MPDSLDHLDEQMASLLGKLDDDHHATLLLRVGAISPEEYW